MCGIVGFIGEDNAIPILLDGLSKLEYRGYDSAGVAYFNDGELEITKSKGRLTVLCDILEEKGDIESNIGIGHTRWATHGKPSDENSHPHRSQSGKFAIVHNGIIENYARIKNQLISEGVSFASETDTEVVAQLLDKYYDGDLLSTVARVTDELQGSYALGILCSDYPDRLVAVRNASPLIVGLSDDGNFIASDIPAVLSHTRKIYRLENNELVLLTKKDVQIFDHELNPIHKKVETVTWDVTAAEKGGYDHFMIKEINEQPRAIHDTVSPRVSDSGDIVLDGISLTADDIRKFNKVFILGCGSAYHAGVVGKYVIERLCRISVETDLASEFRYRNPIVDENSLVIVISQSGETADTLEALRAAKRAGARSIGVVNVIGSAIANEADDVLYTWAGPEISVATTKAYSAQVVTLYLIALHIAQQLGTISRDECRRLLSSVMKLPDKIRDMIDTLSPQIKELAKKYKDAEHAYFLGRNIDYAVALEASLKLKEISYIHSEAYAAGELKHGTISLIEEGTLVVALAGCARIFEKTMSNVKEVKARGAYVLGVTTSDNTIIETESDDVIYIPRANELVMPSLEVVPLQLLGYYIALARGCDIDKPRNLAKSVTVE